MKQKRKFVFALLLVALVPAVGFAAQFTLTWTDNSTNETGFRIERAAGLNATQGFVEIATVGAGVTSYVDAGLPNATAYSYRLRAYNAAGNSGYSNVASGTTPPEPPSVPAAPGAPVLEAAGVLSNISTRGVVMVASDPLIGGFTIAGGPAKVLIRGVGPALAAFAVPSPMADPQITLYSGSTQIGTNDNWSGQAVADAATAAGAFALAAGSKDAAIVLTLPAGSYTVHLSGVSGGQGAALVEIYAVP
jgi:hypothetical protein